MFEVHMTKKNIPLKNNIKNSELKEKHPHHPTKEQKHHATKHHAQIDISSSDIELQKLNTETDQTIKEATQEENQKEETSDSKYLIIAIITILGILAAIFIGFTLYDKYADKSVVTIDDLHQKNLEQELGDQKGYIYNGFSFIKADGLWWTQVTLDDGKAVKIPLRYGPKEVEDVKITGTFDPKAFNLEKEMYVSLADPTAVNKYYNLAMTELRINLLKGLQRPSIGACTQNTSECKDWAIINCTTTKSKPVIVLDLTNESFGINLAGSCVTITGENEQILKGVDRILYQWYGVMS